MAQQSLPEKIQKAIDSGGTIVSIFMRLGTLLAFLYLAPIKITGISAGVLIFIVDIKTSIGEQGHLKNFFR